MARHSYTSSATSSRNRSDGVCHGRDMRMAPTGMDRFVEVWSGIDYKAIKKTTTVAYLKYSI